MPTATIDYRDGDTVCEAYVSHDGKGGKRPAVLVAHQWGGQGPNERAAADRLAALGYVGFAVDVYGKGRRGEPGGDNGYLMAPFMADRAALRARLLAAVEAARSHEAVDPEKIAIIGYCFGGLCALDLARANAPALRGAVSIHGIFPPPNLGPQADIDASVLILHGWEDPLAKPDEVLGVAKELTDAKADWQLHAYGHAMHAFTAPTANAPEKGLAYDPKAAARSWASIEAFLAEVLA
ncbi:dienelactone hydrolase family protein [Sphingoaurantiacus capsulatus]|uniref:Dienelactone hydrolase family protein n=1 Tax=Sphingoaurantiacus capsulatus TaxID=1771310 RepID=A0ABV7XBD3_9SPHN